MKKVVMTQLGYGQPLYMLTVVAAFGVLGVFGHDCGNDEFWDPYTSKCDPCDRICAVGDCSNVCPNFSRQTDAPSTTTAVTITTVTTRATEHTLSTFAVVIIILAAVLFLLFVALLSIIIYKKFHREKRDVFDNKVTTKSVEETARDSSPETVPLTNVPENVPFESRC